MFDHARAVDRIERAIDHEPYCPVCGASTSIVDEDGLLVLRCSATIEPEGLVARLGAAMLPHLRRSVLDLREELAA